MGSDKVLNQAPLGFGQALWQGAIGKMTGGVIDSGIGLIDAITGNARQKRLMDYQYRLQQRMMNDIREYNSPANMRKLYERAGLNYQAMMSGEGGAAGQTASAMSAPSVGSMPVNSSVAMRGADPLTVGSVLSQIKVNESQANLNDANAGVADSQRDLNYTLTATQEVFKTNAQTHGALSALKLQFEKEVYTDRVDQVKANLDTALESLNILHEDLISAKFRNSLNPLQERLLRQSYDVSCAQEASYLASAYFYNVQGDRTAAEIPYVAGLMQAQTAELKSRAKLQDSERRLNAQSWSWNNHIFRQEQWRWGMERWRGGQEQKMQPWHNTATKIQTIASPIATIFNMASRGIMAVSMLRGARQLGNVQTSSTNWLRDIAGANEWRHFIDSSKPR